MLQGQNPVLRGFHPDPCLIRVEDDYYLATSTFQSFGGVQLYHSKDLVHWESLPSPLSRVSQLDLRGAPNSGGVWAPCLSYSDGTFYLIYTSVRNFHGIYKDTPNYLVTTTDIRGEWSEPIYLNSSGFDPSLFHDDDGRKYLVNMRWDHRSENHAFEGIVIQEYSPEAKKLIGKAVNIYKGTGFGATEAPHLYKKDGYYYLMVAEGGTMYHHGVQLARSRSLYGPYESDTQPVIATRDCPEPILQRTGHGSYIDTPNGAGTVAKMTLSYTYLNTPDNLQIVIPNSTLSAGKVINYTELGTRRVDHTITASYDASVEDVRRACLEAVARTAKVMDDPAPVVYVSAYGESSISYAVRMWCDCADYWDVYFASLENIRACFAEAGVKMTYNHLNVHIVEK